LLISYYLILKRYKDGSAIFKLFLFLAEGLHFGRGAERLKFSQPPLSRMIQEIENEPGILYFERTKGSVMLTLAGAFRFPKLLMLRFDRGRTTSTAEL